MKILINIDVPELGPAIAFYQAALGLHVARVLDDDVAELTGASSVLYLLQKPAALSPAKNLAQTRQYARHWTPVHIDFVVNDLEKAARRAVSAGARQESDCIEWRGSKCITFADPFGHGFCLIQLNGETYSGST
jgi:predicted enzyme related to lactoylglutathione lyase